jgi:uncharacterized protein (DUF433 family)
VSDRVAGLSQAFDGAYEVPRAAAYLRASRLGLEYLPSKRSLMHWIRAGLDVLGRDMMINFEDLISMRIIAALRTAGLSWAKIHTAEDQLRKLTSKRRPFATEYMWTEQSEIFIQFKSSLLAASKQGQLAFELLRDYLIPLNDLTYENHVAATWEPRSGILVHPQIQFGESCIKGTRIPTKAVWGMVRGGDRPAAVARAYRIDEEDIQKAVDWEDAVAACGRSS